MNLLLFSAADRLDDQHVQITDQRLEHLLYVLRAQVGDTVRVGEIDGLVGSAEIIDLQTEAAVLRVQLAHPPPDKLPVTVILALPRPKMLRRMLRAVAEFGVGELHLIHSYRVEKSYWQTPVLEKETIRHYCLQGLQQARDTRLPVVHCHRRFKPFAQDTLPGLINGKQALLAHPGDFPTPTHDGAAETIIVIGPEGGFIPYEVELLQASGCTTMSLGPRILRVENALPYLLGKLF